MLHRWEDKFPARDLLAMATETECNYDDTLDGVLGIEEFCICPGLSEISNQEDFVGAENGHNMNKYAGFETRKRMIDSLDAHRLNPFRNIK